ncbi:MAG: 3'(2'),5'-bisphosphate nucleotidase CysQ, partial [Gammaproteobacteria bacterium]|nr:3'(2'),5'-bisphosphate nucleotidase CysQ [Gammaproteobacteria bacterium]
MADISMDLLSQVVRIARKAGEEILAIYDTEIEVEYKGDESPLTQADKSSNDVIVKALEKLEPAYPVLSEEGKAIPFEQRKTWKRYWLIDPLDGTKEFIKKNGEFTVNIALIENGQAILGVVYAPVLDVCYYAASGIGAYKQTSELDPAHISVRRYQVGDVWNVVASRSHLSAETEALVGKLGSSEFVSMGSS